MMKGKMRLRALTFEYYGISRRELRAAEAVGRHAKVEEHRMVRLPDLKEASDIGDRFVDYPPTYIPMRNAVFYSLAASFAEEVRAEAVVGGHNKDDARVFRDVSVRFFDDIQRAYWSGSKILSAAKTRIVRPLAGLTKAEVIKEGAGLGVPFGLTWSCHRDGAEHCWQCPGCTSRSAAFWRAGIPDPLDDR